MQKQKRQKNHKRRNNHERGALSREVPDYILGIIEDQIARLGKDSVTDYEKLLANIKYRIEAMMREKGITFCKTSIRKWGKRRLQPNR